MAKDLTVMLEDRPGTLAQLGETLAKAGVNIDGVCGVMMMGGQAAMHVLVQDGAKARKAIEGAGMKVVGDRDVLVVDVEDKPGTLGTVARKLATAGVNIDLIYLATKTRLVIGAKDLEKARQATGARR